MMKLASEKFNSDERTLLVLPALCAASTGDGEFVLTQKFLDGVLEYVKLWPGRVIVGMQQSDHVSDNLDNVYVSAKTLPFTLTWLDTDEAMRALIDQSYVVLASLIDRHTHLADLCQKMNVPLVYLTEYSVNTRRQIVRAESSNAVLRWRREHWTTKLERRYVKAVSKATGVQCNGTPTYDAYRDLNANPLLFFDSRVHASQLAEIATLEKRLTQMQAGGPLRLAFSGRLIEMKGADHLPKVAAELKRLNVPFTMDICGDGVLVDQIRRDVQWFGLADCVRLQGVLDFHTQLIPFVSNSVDLFVCCHRQGDPSCTYLETLSCGVPIVGYDNEAFRGLCDLAKVGWISPMDEPALMAVMIAELHSNHTLLIQAAHGSLAFARHHTFEKTMKSRIDHITRCASIKAKAAEVAA